MNEGEVISVIIPSYNHQRYIVEAVESVLNQSYKNVELIVVDDGSKDSSIELLRGYQGNPSFKLIVQENAGAHAAINKGIASASGDYLCVLNSDDVYSEDRLEILIQCARNTKQEYVFIFSSLLMIDGESNLTEDKRYIGYLDVVNNSSTLNGAELFLRGNLAMTTSNFFFSKKLFEAVGGFRDLRYCHDWDWALRATAFCDPFWMKLPLLRYRVHDANTISEGNIYSHIAENAFIFNVAAESLKTREMFDLSAARDKVLKSIVTNESFLPLPSIVICLLKQMNYSNDRLLEMIKSGEIQSLFESMVSQGVVDLDDLLSLSHAKRRVEHGKCEVTATINMTSSPIGEQLVSVRMALGLLRRSLIASARKILM